jgi:hypothetical protein
MRNAVAGEHRTPPGRGRRFYYGQALR